MPLKEIFACFYDWEGNSWLGWAVSCWKCIKYKILEWTLAHPSFPLNHHSPIYHRILAYKIWEALSQSFSGSTGKAEKLFIFCVPFCGDKKLLFFLTHVHVMMGGRGSLIQLAHGGTMGLLKRNFKNSLFRTPGLWCDCWWCRNCCCCIGWPKACCECWNLLEINFV